VRFNGANDISLEELLKLSTKNMTAGKKSDTGFILENENAAFS
jgi:hypothetical protein